MDQKNVEKYFELLDDIVENIQTKENITYLDSLVIALEYIFSKTSNGELLNDTMDYLNESIKTLTIAKLEKEEIRKVVQLATLKGMRGATQQQHLITPDTVAMFVGYIVNKFVSKQKDIRIFDPAIGSANLLTSIINQLEASYKAYGSDVDTTLIQLGLMNANLQQIKIDLFHQDSLQPLLLDPVDFVVSDLPVGYYPDDLRAQSFELHSPEGHAYAHHLFIEQSMHYTKEGGFLVFVVPNFLFNSDQSDKLHLYLQKHSHIVGLLQLPSSIFTSEKQAKSILILQKKGKQTKSPKQALIAQLPSFKNPKATLQIVEKINNWFKEEGY
ncbi:N-6 DNA Methylase [Paraliobacillus sp. PM-2]|uniref:class I SAM-dependent methyltransferase n=1 Tax=Paraliobacillus sp. PM-2 TaxID=1462524 RepID=UPI00061BD3BD|nr:class I SAM-dependent methyltransferase [Paraliobacillus sp. PM-2]CQR48133.1 N-6 DNA Methylase [Paraliobacillus sp. PM-2]